MNDRTATPGQTTKTTAGKPPATVERFRVTTNLESCSELRFESTNDLAAHLKDTLSDTHVIDLVEEQVLIRYNVDGEGAAIVYVDSAHGNREPDEDLLTMSSAIDVLRDARHQLRALLGGAA